MDIDRHVPAGREAARSPLPSALGGRWDGLTLDVAAPDRPGLRVEVAGGRRMLIRQGDRVVLLARPRAGHFGVHYLRTGRYRSPLPPITAAHARRVREASTDDDAWAARWSHAFTGWLHDTGEGPLHRGSWVLAHGMPSWGVVGHWWRLRDVDPDRGHITWFGYGDPVEDQRDVLPLRPLSPADDGRVRAFRKQARDGMLPPALLWWVSGLNTLLVLDGHDRIAAALAEGTVPGVLVLSPAVDARLGEAWQRREVDEYAHRMGHLHRTWGDVSVPAVSRRFAASLGHIARSEGTNRAWLLPGGRTAWDRLVSQLAPDWINDGRR
ncbi:hypothetical protein OG799_10525 [Micromonospora sp. NBC_00898]|uniref:hypothetical protein n=1 Tax=Micromonospora sp. NBC_00898 TaxID=2975981 RepID=UPI00386E1FD5|nr:hypothetical protein OG799_10525 [Micromonospora sp. NBC_00898]